MKELGIVAIYKLSDDSIEVISTRTNSPLYDWAMNNAKCLEMQGAKLVQCVITTDKVLLFKQRLKAYLLELRNLTERNNKYLQEHMGFLSLEVLCDTQKIMEELESTQMLRVASVTSRLLNMEVDVTDELALACLNYRQQVRGF